MQEESASDRETLQKREFPERGRKHELKVGTGIRGRGANLSDNRGMRQQSSKVKHQRKKEVPRNWKGRSRLDRKRKVEVVNTPKRMRDLDETSFFCKRRREIRYSRLSESEHLPGGRHSTRGNGRNWGGKLLLRSTEMEGHSLHVKLLLLVGGI